MAIFNYSSNYSDISKYIKSSTNTVSSVDLLRMFFSPDTGGAGHLITHGIDFTPDYSNGVRGLVPANAGTLKSTYLRGDGWQSLWSQAAQNAAKTAGTETEYLQSTLVSAADVQDWISASYTTQQAMRFKGTIAVSGSTVTGVNGGTGGFPTTCAIGDTYKVNGNGSIAGQTVETGDLLICYKAGTGSALNDAEYWTVVQDNVEHLLSHTINGTSWHVYTNDSNATGFTVYAPTTAGTKGQIVVSNGSGAPQWANTNTITAGKVASALSVTVGLSMTTSGGTALASYDGSSAAIIKLNKATTAALGGVMLDDGTHGYAASGSTTDKPTMSVTADGMLYISRDNIINALGYTPGNSTGTVAGIVVATSATGTTNGTTANTTTYVNIVDTSTTKNVLGSFQIKGGTGINVTGASGAVSVALKVATTSAIGGVAIHRADTTYTVTPYLGSALTANVSGNSAESKYYGVQIDKNNAAFVYVPWISHLFNASGATKGLVPTKTADTTAAGELTSSSYVLGSDAKWYKLPSSAFVGTWRPIKVTKGSTTTDLLDNTVANDKALTLVQGEKITLTPNATNGSITISTAWRDVKVPGTNRAATSIGDKELIFADSDGIFMEASSTATATTVKACLAWYNIDSDTYEVIS